MLIRMLAAALAGVLLLNDAHAQRNSIDEANDCRKADGSDATIAACTRALALIYRNRGLAWSVKGELDRAIADYDESIRLDPNYVAAYGSRGDALQQKGDYERAIASYSDVIRLAPSDSQGWNQRCFTRALANLDLPMALADCMEALRLKPNDPFALDSRGLVHLRLGRLEEAYADYDAALKAGLEQAEYALYVRGMMKRRKGDTAGGDADIAAAKAREPKIEAIFARLGIAL